MKAAILRRHGGPECIEVGEWPTPEPGPGEVAVDLVTAAFNRRDWWIRRNPERDVAPCILGSDGAGRVVAVAPGVTGVELGAEVVINPGIAWGAREEAPGPAFEILGIPRQGTHAERVCVPAENVFARPQRLTWEESAAFPLAALTAWRALVTRGHLAAGQTVLVTGAGSGVACFAIQIARALGARVLVTSSRALKIDRAIAVGADGGALYTEADWPERIRAATGGTGVDLVIDSAGAAAWPGALATLRDGGTLVTFGDTAGDEVPVDVFDVFWRQLSIHGTTLGSPSEFADLLTHVESATWRPVVDAVFPLAEARAAWERLDADDRFGKIVLRVRD